jgi:hypothetical protein
MIFDCHFRHAIVINRLSIQINRHLSTPIDCQRRPAIQSFDYFINRLPPIAQRRPVIQSFDYFINRLPTIAQRRPAIQSFDYFITPIAQRRPAIQSFDYFINRLPRVYTLGWSVSRLRRWRE